MKQEDQYNYFFLHAEYLGLRVYYNMKRVLYTLDGNFYEVIYMPDKNKIDEIVKISPEIAIKFYSEKVNLPKL